MHKLSVCAVSISSLTLEFLHMLPKHFQIDMSFPNSGQFSPPMLENLSNYPNYLLMFNFTMIQHSLKAQGFQVDPSMPQSPLLTNQHSL